MPNKQNRTVSEKQVPQGFTVTGYLFFIPYSKRISVICIFQPTRQTIFTIMLAFIINIVTFATFNSI
jgi:hypothetical protein